MKINFILTNVYKSGGMKVLFSYGEELKKRGHDVVFYRRLLPYNFNRGKSSIKDSIGLYFRKIKTFLSAKGPTSDFYSYTFQLKSVPLIHPLFVRKADAVIATEWVTAYSVNNLPKNRGSKFYFIQGYENWNSNTELVDKSYQLPLFRITISSFLKNYLFQRFNSESLVIFNGIYENEFEYSCYHQNKSDITISFIYSAQELKNGKLLLLICNEIHQKYPEIKITAFGFEDISLHPYIKYYTNPDKKTIAGIYKESDIFMFASGMEGFGLPPAEAMLSGCAVITTKAGAITEYSEHLQSAIHVEEISIKEYLKWVEYLIKNTAEITRLGSNGRNAIKEKLTWEKSAEQFESVLENNLKM